MTTCTLAAPAKVNLFLGVYERRPDGYHRLETLFERLDLADELTVRRRPTGCVLTCSDPAMPTDARNLVIRAAEHFFQAAGISEGMAAHLVKRIPVAGGLGGGSSDAAATLLGLNTIYDQPLSGDQLCALGRQLGADVPFFLSGAAVAWGRGRGDEITPVAPPTTPLWHLLVNPGVAILTNDVYAAFDRLAAADSRLTVLTPNGTVFERSVQAGDAATVAAHLANALEPAIAASYPAIREVKAALTAGGALGVLVSGSGSTTFGLMAGEGQARALAARLRTEHPAWTVVTARTALELPAYAAAPVRGDRRPDR